MTAIVLNGTVQGRTPLSGSGKIGPLGAVTSTGSLKVSGAEPVTYSGTMTLAGASGSITLSLFGRLFGPNRLGAPIDLTYTITGGTGAFQGATGSGTAIFSPSGFSSTGAFALAFTKVA